MTITTVILIKENSQDTHLLNVHYIQPLVDNGLTREEITVLPLLFNPDGKIVAKTAYAYLDKLLNAIPSTVTTLVVADAPYFKFITGEKSLKETYGKTVYGKHTGYDRFECVYVPNYRSIFKQPDNEEIIKIGINTISGNKIKIRIDYEDYGYTHGSDKILLDQLFQYPELVVDIESTGLSLDSKILTIAFAWSKYEGIAIDLDINGSYYLRKFFEQYSGKLIFHNALFDVKLLIRWLFMEHAQDFKGMNEGLKHFRNVDDTMLLAYLEKNSTTQFSLSLKDLALDFVGNYAIDTDNLTQFTKKEILRYNLIDTLATYYLWEKYGHQKTSEAYTTIFRPSIPVLLKCMLVGLPMDNDRVEECQRILTAKEIILSEQIQLNPHVVAFNKILRTQACIAKNKTLKKLCKTVDDFKDLYFNPGSGDQKGALFNGYLKLPVLEKTKTGKPATGAEVLADLKNHTNDPDTLSLIDNIIELEDVKKINGTFISALAKEKDYLHGNLRLGGTQSGRLSANNPNLQNLPSKGSMGKLVKSCFKAKDGWLFCGADFSSLEERIGAILSKDPERIKIYKDGFDGHSIRALKYFPDKMPDIKAKVDKAETATKFWRDKNGDVYCS